MNSSYRKHLELRNVLTVFIMVTSVCFIAYVLNISFPKTKSLDFTNMDVYNEQVRKVFYKTGKLEAYKDIIEYIENNPDATLSDINAAIGVRLKELKDE